MADATIDKLGIEVSADSGSASRGLNRLIGSLERLDGRLSGPTFKLGQLKNAIQRFNAAANSIPVAKLQQLSNIKINKTTANGIVDLAAAIDLIPEGAGSKLASLGSIGGLGAASMSASLPKTLAAVGEAAGSIPEDAAERLSSLSSLTGLSGITISKTVPNNLRAIGQALSSLDEASLGRLRSVASSLNSLRGLEGMSLTKSINGLKRLPEALKAYEDFDMEGFADKLDRLNRVIEPLATNVGKLASAVRLLPPSMRTAAAATRTVASSLKYAEAQSISASSALTGAAARIAGAFSFGKLLGGLRIALGVLKTCVDYSSQYAEDMNLYAASMGSYADAATRYARKVQDLMGIDMGEWSRNQGTFMTLTTGMGEATDKAAVMSQQLTQLGYDIASFYNITTDEAMAKLQSGIAGELEPLRRIGWDLSDARMQLEATNLGIQKNTSEMTQAEKVALRYRLIMEQVTQVHGDMARTLASPANQMRILSAQARMAARAVGNVLIPVLNAILPYAIAAAKAIQILANTIARFFGIDATFEVDYSGLDTSGFNSGAPAPSTTPPIPSEESGTPHPMPTTR